MAEKMKANDFQGMRDFYVDMLRLRNYNDKFYYAFLKEFDKAVAEKDLDKIAEIMKTINVELV